MSKREKLIEVHRAANEAEAEVIRSLLDSCDIPCVLNPALTAFAGAFQVKVMCLESMAETAREVIRGEGDNA